MFKLDGRIQLVLPLSFIALVAIVIIRSPLDQSFWLDETITAWVARGTITSVWDKAIRYQGFSPLYFLLLTPFNISPHLEMNLRIPSCVGFGLFLGALFFLAQRLISTRAAWISITLALSHDLTLKTAFQARPYALALFTLTLSVLALILWSDQKKWWWATLSLASFLATFYLHYILLPACIIHFLIFFTMLIDRRLSRRDMVYIGFLFSLLIVGMIPGCIQLVMLGSKREQLQFMREPRLLDLLFALIPPSMLVVLVVAFLVTVINKGFKEMYPRLQRKSILFVIWWLLPAVLLFVVSRCTSGSIFVDRFYVWLVPGFALLVAAYLERLPSDKHWWMLAVIIPAFFVRESGRSWVIEDWRGAAEYVNGSRPERVAFYSGLAEGDVPSVRKDAAVSDYLTAPFQIYPVTSRVTLMPADPALEPDDTWLSEVLGSEDKATIITFKNRKSYDATPGKLADQRICDYVRTKSLQCEQVWPRPSVEQPLVVALVISKQAPAKKSAL